MQWDSDEEAERVGPVFENEAAVSAASKQRVKRYRFKTFAQRIAEIDVDVYRSIGPSASGGARSEPWQGATSFFQEHLLKWRELNASEHFLKAELAVRPMSMTLPQVVHHKDEIMSLLLRDISPSVDTRLSLEPLMHLAAVLSRDLQKEYLPLLPSLIDKITDVLEGGGATLPEVIEASFVALSTAFKHLAKHLASDLPWLLKITSRLRYSLAAGKHVRSFAAQAAGYLLRSCPPGVLDTAIKCILSEASYPSLMSPKTGSGTGPPCWERVQGAGLLLAEGCVGVNHGLHSRAQRLLSSVLQEDAVSPNDLAKVSYLAADPSQHQIEVSQEQMRARATATSRVMLSRLLNYIRRGGGGDMWACLIEESNRRLQRVQGQPAPLSSQLSLARIISLVAQAVLYYRGSRVDAYDPLLDLLSRIVQKEGTLNQTQPSVVSSPSSSGKAMEPFLALWLPEQVMRFAVSLVEGHAKTIGASLGSEAVHTWSKDWSPLFYKTQPRHLLPFLTSLLVTPPGAGAVEAFAPIMLGAAGRIVMLSETPAQLRTSLDAQASPLTSSHEAAGLDLEGTALGLLLEICEAATRLVKSPPSPLPLIVRAQPGGVKLAGTIRAMVKPSHLLSLDLTQSSNDDGRKGPIHAIQRLWCAMKLLPHACEGGNMQVFQACREIKSAVEHISSQPSSEGIRPHLLLLHGTAVELISSSLSPSASGSSSLSSEGSNDMVEALVETASSAIEWMTQHPNCFLASKAAGCALNAARKWLNLHRKHPSALPPALAARLETILSEQALEQQLKSSSMLSMLCSPEKAVRAAALTLLAAYESPYLIVEGAVKQPGSKQSIDPHSLGRCETFSLLLSINSEPCTLEAGRRWAVALLRQGSQVEYNRIPVWMIPGLFHGLLGVLRVRFSPLWSGCCEALASCMTHQKKLTWPIMKNALEATQEEFLGPSSSSSFEDGMQREREGRRGGIKRGAGCGEGKKQVSKSKKAKRENGHQLEAADEELDDDDVEEIEMDVDEEKGAHGSQDEEEEEGEEEEDGSSLPSSSQPRLSGNKKRRTSVSSSHTPKRTATLEEIEAESLITPGLRLVPPSLTMRVNMALDPHSASLASSHGVSAEDTDRGIGNNSNLGSTDPGNRLEHLINAMSKSSAATSALGSGGLEGAEAKDWVPIFIRYVQSRVYSADPSGQNASLDEGAMMDEVLSRVGGRAWRTQMRVWLTFLSGFKSLRGLPRFEEVKRGVAMQLMEDEPLLQAAAIKALKPFKLPFLPQEILDHLGRFCDNKTLREELTTFPLARGAEQGIPDKDRPGVIPLLIRLLFPKLRKRSGRLGGKGAPGSARAAVLNFLGHLEPSELRPLLELLLDPLSSSFTLPSGPDSIDDEGSSSQGRAESEVEARMDAENRLLPPQWWACHLGTRGPSWWLQAVDDVKMEAQPARRKIGFLNSFEDLMTHLGYRLAPFLPVLLSITTKLLAEGTKGIRSAPSGSGGGGGGQGDDRSRELRSSSLKILSLVWSRFPTDIDHHPFLEPIMNAIQPIMGRMPAECYSEKPPALLECIFSLSASPGLVVTLANVPSNKCESAEESIAESLLLLKSATTSIESWRVNKLGGQLIKSLISSLESPNCSDASRSMILDVVDNILEHASSSSSLASSTSTQPPSSVNDGDPKQTDMVTLVLGPWLEDLLVALKTVVSSVWEGGASLRPPSLHGKGNKGKKGSHHHATRELSVLERLGSRVESPSVAVHLGNALCALVTSRRAKGGGGGSARLDERGLTRAMAAMAALWNKAPDLSLSAPPLSSSSPSSANGAVVIDEGRMRTYCESLAMLTVRLSSREARQALAASYQSAARLLPEASESAALLADLCSWSPSHIEEPDYERRLRAYSRMTPDFWLGMNRRQALPLVLACLYDLRDPDDLAVRQGAAQAMERFIEAASLLSKSQEGQLGQEEEGPDSLMKLLPQIVYSQLRNQIVSSSLAVRQEHLSLLRSMAMGLPSRFPELALLSSQLDPETDFFLNVAHLQLHRRSRAFSRLSAMALKYQPMMESDPENPDLIVFLRCLQDVCFPLIAAVLKESLSSKGNEKKASGHGAKEGDVGREAGVADSAVNALGSAARLLQWPQYQGLLLRFLKLMKDSGGSSKPLVRAFCAVLDSFHFKSPRDVFEQDPSLVLPSVAADHLGEEEEEEEEGSNQRKILSEIDDKRATAASIHQVLTSRVLPCLQSHIVEEDQEGVRSPVALALVKLLRLLPPDIERTELPRALRSICNLLKNRQQKVRDDTRAVLVVLASELGPRYMPYMLQVLRSSLPNRGYTSHVVGYVAHAVIDSVVTARLRPLSKSGKKRQLNEEGPTVAPAPVAASVAVASAVDGDDEEEEEWGGGEGAVDKSLSGFLDESLELALPLIEEELFGEVSEAKDVVAFTAAYKEAKRVRGYETYRLLASAITLGTHLDLLLSIVRDRLHLASSPTVKNKLSQLLQFAARGVRENPTATAEPLMVWVHGAMREGLEADERERERAEASAGAAVGLDASLNDPKKKAKVPKDTSKGPDVSQPSFLTALRNKDGVEMLSEADRASLHHHLLLEFALTLLHSAVKRGPLSNRSPETLAFLDPVLPLLARSLGSRHQGCVNAALRCLCHLVTLGPSSTPQVGKDKDNRAFLPSLTSTCNAAGKAITRLLKKAPNAAHPVALECFRLLGAMLRGCESYKPSTGQVRFLLGWLFADRHADDSPGRQNAFALLRAVLSRKIVVPEVYDVMEWVQEVMVRSQSNNVRSMCSSTLLQFLLDYPLGPKRLAQHLSFLTANLAYEHESGRMAVLDTLGAVIHKFPSSVIQAHRELLMLPLLTRLVNDVSAKARALAGGVLRSLLQGLEQEHRDQFAEFCATWLAAGDQAGGSRSSDKASMLRRTAAQALCALADVEGTKFGKRMVALGPLVVSVLSSQSSSFDATAIDAAKEEEEADDNADPDSSTNSTSRCPGWQEAYYGLLLIEKVLSKCPSSLTYPDESPTACRELWELVPKLLLHRHLWMRKAASRVMCLGLALPPIAMAGFWAARETRAAELSFAFFMQLEAEGADDGVCVQAIKCLVQVAIRLKAQEDTKRQERDQGTHPIDEGKDKAGDEEEEEEQEEEEEEVEEKKEEDAEEDEQEEEEEKVEAKLQAFTLQGLMRRMAKLAGDNRVMFQTQRMAALRWIAAVATALTGPAITPYLSTLLVPLYRLSELVGSGLTPSLKPHEEEAKALGDEVMSHLRQVVGADAMLQAFAVARDKVRGSRMERKKKQAMQNLVDPEAAARARVKRGVKKTVGRKRKMEEMKRLRSARVFQSSGPRGRGRGRGGGGGGAKRGLTGEGPDAAGGREVSGKRQRLGAAFSSGRGSIGGGGGRGGAGRGSSRGGRGGGSGRGGGKGRGTSFKSLSKFGLS